MNDILQPIDVLVLLKLCVLRDEPISQMRLAGELFISPSSVNAALKHAERVRLYSPNRRRVNAPAFEEALVHGAKYFLGAVRGTVGRGTPTAWAAPPLVNQIATDEELPPIWPDANGEVRGIAFEPLYPSAPKAAKKDSALYELLALVDALREGGARVSRLATDELHARVYRS